MKKIIFFVLSGILIGLTTCDDDAVFKNELYKNVIALISSGDYNIFQEVHAFSGDEETTGYIPASCGGTIAPDENIVITLEENGDQLNAYNKAIYDADEDRYARLLPKEKYTIDEYRIRIPAGERSGKTMIRVRSEGLSPDSIYFVSLKVKEVSGFEVNEKKSDVLYQVLLKNAYAAQSTDMAQLWAGSVYNMTGLRNGSPTLYSKQLQPLSQKKVRLMAGTEAFQADTVIINRASIVLEVTEDNDVHISPYKGIYVNQVDGDPDFPNIFAKELDSLTNKYYNVFLLSYEYRISGGSLVQMKEELRMEVE